MPSRNRWASKKHKIELEENEESFCSSLAMTLRCVTPPLTVGLYVPLGYCKKSFVDKVKEYMETDEQRAYRTNGQLTFREKVTAIFRMIFYSHVPLPTLQDKPDQRVHNIFIHFSAWEYAGADRVWAGLITTLCDDIEKQFGRIPMSVYRTTGWKPNTDDSNRDRNWIAKKFLCLPLWVATLLNCGLTVGLVVFICLYGFPLGSFIGNVVVLGEVITGIGLGVPLLPVAKKVFNWICNVVVTQKAQLEKQMNGTNIKLGFMGKVKEEVNIITNFLQFMETFRKRKFRVVLKITNLDRCTPDKVMRVLDAMNILLSDSKSPFISILVADLNTIVNCLEGVEKNVYEFLNRIITLPFSFPKTDDNNKTQLLQKMVNDRVKQEEMFILSKKSEPCGCCTTADWKLCDGSRDDSQVPLVVDSSMKKEVSLIQKALCYLKNENMKKYLPSNKLEMKRIINTIVVMARLMMKKYGPGKISPQKMTSWVVLANQWPCRLSWILQCIEDDKQMGGFDEEKERKEITLLKVYETYMEEFDDLKDELKMLLELDGDPEVFQNFLGREWEDSITSPEVEEKDSTVSLEEKTKILVEDVAFFLPCTVNLDSSLKRHMELERGSRNLNWIKNTGGLSKSNLLKMSEKDICKEMDSLNLDNVQEYKERLRNHRLNGRALLYSNRKEIKDALDMSLGDWVAFHMYFLDSVPVKGLCHSTSPYYFAKNPRFDLQKSPPVKEAGGSYPSKLSNNNTS